MRSMSPRVPPYIVALLTRAKEKVQATLVTREERDAETLTHGTMQGSDMVVETERQRDPTYI